MTLTLTVIFGGPLVAMLSAWILNIFSPDVPVRRLAWLAASVPSVLVGFYMMRFIIGQFENAGPGNAPFVVMATPIWYVMGALGVGYMLVIGYPLSRHVITFLRRR